MRPAPSCLSPLISMVKAQRIPAGISGGGVLSNKELTCTQSIC